MRKVFAQYQTVLIWFFIVGPSKEKRQKERNKKKSKTEAHTAAGDSVSRKWKQAKTAADSSKSTRSGSAPIMTGRTCSSGTAATHAVTMRATALTALSDARSCTVNSHACQQQDDQAC
jgi:hypothetical protein